MASSFSAQPAIASAVVSHDDWIAARKALLRKEKEFMKLRDELSRERRELPRERVEKQYVFDSPKGKEGLADLFAGRSQLMVYHFMLGPGWSEGCPSCSFIADGFDGVSIHLAQRDVTFMAISRATLPEIETFKKRMGWKFKWASSSGSDFNFDYNVSFSEKQRSQGKVLYNYEMIDAPVEELPGASVFYKNPSGEIFHTYSTYARGLDPMVNTYQWLDLAPKGRDEDSLAHSMSWVRHHDKYDNGYVVDVKALYTPPAKV